MASPSQNNGVPTGQLKPSSTFGEYNNLFFVVSQLISKLQTATLVQIVSCTNDGSLSPVGFVDVIPMVNQVDGQGNPTPHVTIYNVPYFRLQGGANAVIIDPEPGDIGIAMFASRDITKVKATKSVANPGSLRQYNFADALYMGGVLNGLPSQYVQFKPGEGIHIHSPDQVKITAPDVLIQCNTFRVETQTMTVQASASTTITTPIFTVNGQTLLNGPLSQGTGSAGGDCTMQGPLTVTNDVTAQGTSVHSHIHGTPSGNSTPPL